MLLFYHAACLPYCLPTMLPAYHAATLPCCHKYYPYYHKTDPAQLSYFHHQIWPSCQTRYVNTAITQMCPHCSIMLHTHHPTVINRWMPTTDSSHALPYHTIPYHTIPSNQHIPDHIVPYRTAFPLFCLVLPSYG